MNLEDVLVKCKSLSDISRMVFGKENYSNREKSKKLLYENGILWKEWVKRQNERPKRYCLFCGKEITNEEYRKKFCNSSCAASYNNNKRKKKKSCYCVNCGSELKNSRSKYCSSKCKMDFEYKQYIGRWKEGKETGLSGEGGISDRIRRYLFEKNSCKCQICGWGEQNTHSGRVPLQVHHIDGDFKNNKESNLQLLCPNCHSLTENFGTINGHRSSRKDRRVKQYMYTV